MLDNLGNVNNCINVVHTEDNAAAVVERPATGSWGFTNDNESSVPIGSTGTDTDDRSRERALNMERSNSDGRGSESK